MGHNELDQPSFTQPLLYKLVANKIPVRDMYRQQLLAEGISESELKELEAKADKENEDSYNKSKHHSFSKEEWNSEQWEKIKDPHLYGKFKDTGVAVDHLTEIGEAISHLPTDKKFHPQIVKIFQARMESIKTGKGIDWGTAEALAFASLIEEGHHIRLSGQDVERGTFSHRHAHVFY